MHKKKILCFVGWIPSRSDSGLAHLPILYGNSPTSCTVPVKQQATPSDRVWNLASWHCWQSFPSSLLQRGAGFGAFHLLPSLPFLNFKSRLIYWLISTFVNHKPWRVWTLKKAQVFTPGLRSQQDLLLGSDKDEIPQRQEEDGFLKATTFLTSLPEICDLCNLPDFLFYLFSPPDSTLFAVRQGCCTKVWALHISSITLCLL